MSWHRPAWRIKEEYRATLSPALLNGLINGEGISRALVCRELPSRTVRWLKPTNPELPSLYLKEYRFPHLIDRIKYLFHPPAEREWHTALRIAQRGIPTFEPLAWGTLRRFGLPAASYLFSREIDHARSLKDCLSDSHSRNCPTTRAARRAIVCSLARFVQDLHRKGIAHQDFHWGNILVDLRNLKHIRWYLTDLHRVRLKPRLSDRERIHNLAALCTAFRSNSSKAERLRFLGRYAHGDERWKKQLRSFARCIEDQSERMWKRIRTRHARRCLKRNAYFTPFRFPGCRGFLNRAFSLPALEQLLQNPGAAFSQSGCSMVKHSNTTSSCILLFHMDEPVSLFIKRYNYQNRLYALKYLFRSSRGKKTWKAAHALLARGIPTPLPVAYAEKRQARMLSESFLITRHIAHSFPLSRIITHGGSGTTFEPAVDKDKLIRQTALLIRTMHKGGIWHRDLKAANILVQRTPDGDLKLYLTDLDGIRIRNELGFAERIRDLSRLNRSLITSPALSMRDRHYFLQCYLGAGRRGDANLRAYWERIRRETAKKLAKVVKNL